MESSLTLAGTEQLSSMPLEDLRIQVPGTQPGPDVNWFGALSKKISLRQNPNQFLNRFRVTSVVQVRATSPASVGLEGEVEERSWRIG